MAYSLSDLLTLAQNAGFTGQSAITAAAIGMAESSGVPSQIGDLNEGGSYGLMQINQIAHPGTAEQALDPQGSYDLAYSISNGGNDFTPWTVYRNGKYQQYAQMISAADASTNASATGSNAPLASDPGYLAASLGLPTMPTGIDYTTQAGAASLVGPFIEATNPLDPNASVKQALNGPFSSALNPQGVYDQGNTTSNKAGTASSGTASSGSIFSGLTDYLTSVSSGVALAILALLLFVIAIWPSRETVQTAAAVIK